MPRTILIHLNVTLPDGRDDIGATEVADAVLSSIEVASDDERIGYTLGRYEYGELVTSELEETPAPFVLVALAEEI